jgi:hypothetical protein
MTKLKKIATKTKSDELGTSNRIKGLASGMNERRFKASNKPQELGPRTDINLKGQRVESLGSVKRRIKGKK